MSWSNEAARFHHVAWWRIIGMPARRTRAASGHAVPAPRAEMNCRLAMLIAIGPSSGGHADWNNETIPRPNRQVCDQLHDGLGEKSLAAFLQCEVTCMALFCRPLRQLSSLVSGA
jgi:hypothetical protein